MEKYTIDELLDVLQYISALAINVCRARCMPLTAKRNEMQKRSYIGAAIIRLETA